MQIRKGNLDDAKLILDLYGAVAENSGGIIRNASEINDKYVNSFLSRCIENGLIYIAMVDDKIIGCIHAYTPAIHAFRHLLSDLTLVVHPEYQRQGIGKKLFEEFLNTVKSDFSHILRVELFVRVKRERVIRFYESLGFKNEGRQTDKILNKEGLLETPIHMAWINPEFTLK